MLENSRVTEKHEKIAQERARLEEVFKDVEKSRQDLITKLLDQAAYLAVENEYLQELLAQTGMIKQHPDRPEIQKPVEASKQYRQNISAYTAIVKTLETVLSRGTGEGADPFEEWLKAKQTGPSEM